MKGNLFSESWFKVAELRVSLLYTVDVQKQYYRGELWYVLQDSFNNNYFRVTPETYHFIALLTPAKTVEEVWEECLGVYKESAPSQEEVIGLLSQLHTNNLLYFKNPPNNEFIFERHREKKQKEMRTKMLSLISIRIPLWNPDRWLNSLLPLIKFIFNSKWFLVWLVVVFLGFKAMAENFDQIYDQTQGMLAQSNLIFIYLSLAFLKLFHELGHAMMNKRFGGPVPIVGVTLLVFTPLPYMDATSSLFFPNRWHRILVGAAGMMVDLFFAAIASLVWAQTGDGLVHSLAFNIMIVGSISSLFFNGNPLVRFDAYYILSDLLEIPNLAQRSRQQWCYWIEKYLFKVENAVAPSASFREAFWLAGYAVASLIYLVFVTAVIILFVTDHFFAVGMILAFISIIVGVFVPLKKLALYLLISPKLAKSRKRAIALSAIMAVVILSFFGLYPFPHAIRAPGVLESEEHGKVYATTEGILEKVHFKNGDLVRAGEVLATLSNYELDLEMKKVKEGLIQTAALKQKAIFKSMADLKPLYEREKVLKEQWAYLEQKKRNLTIVAQSSGTFVASDIEPLQGMWLKRQTQIGSLIAKGGFKFYGIVSQEQAFDLFQETSFQAQIKLHGNAKKSFQLAEIAVIPYQREELPSAALGWLGGGDISVSTVEKSGKKVAEPFFKISGRIMASEDDAFPLLLHGRSGILRLVLPPEPLAVQGYRLIKQTIQKRYKI